MRMLPPFRPHSSRSFSFKIFPAVRLSALFCVAIAIVALAATPSSAGSLGQTLFAKALAMISGAPAMEEAAPQSPSSTMTVERRGHTATRLGDGRVLIAGGENNAGQLTDSEIFDPASGTFSVTGSMTAARADHAAIKLADGRVLISGGRNGAGTLGTTEIFDPAAGTFSSGPSMNVARAGHSATIFSDGRVFVAGGDSGGTAEIYDPAANSFSSAGGSLSTARSMHSAAPMLDGRILIAGGRDGAGNALGTVEIFDTAGGSFSTVDGVMTVARVRPHVHVLFDGKVQIIGGNNDGSMEIYDPLIETIGAYAHVLPETDPCTGFINQILSSQTRAALFYAGSSDASRDRSGHTITELAGSNQALVLGGANSSGAVLSSSSQLNSSTASITTDKLDYAPGETVMITGRGFQPGEIVRLKIHEDPHTPQERGFDASADAGGNFSGEYLVQEYDLSMKFIVGARGLSSGFTAQTTFTDGGYFVRTSEGSTVTVSTIKYPTGVGTVACPTPPPAAPPAGSVTGTLSVTSATPGQSFDMVNNRLGLLIVPVISNEGGAYQSITATGSEGTVLSNNLSGDGTARHICVLSNNGSATNLGTLIINYDAAVATTTTAVNNAIATFGDSSVLLQATVTPTTGTVNTGTVTFTVKQGLTTIGTATTSAIVSVGNASVNYALPVGTNAGSYTIEATYNAGAGFTGSTDPTPGTLTIGKAATITTVTCGAGPFTYNGLAHEPCSANVTGAGGLNEVLTVSYLNNVNAGTATASASYTESANYFGSSDSENFTIDKAATTTTVTCGAGPFTYNGLAQEPCSATVTGAGGLNNSLTVSYLNNVNAGTATANASYAESANYFGSSDSENFTIDKAATITTVTCGAGPFTYNGLAHEPCSANVTGAGGLNEVLTVNYLNNVNAGTATASASYTESANYFGSSDSENFTIDKAATTTTVTCGAGPFTYNGLAHEPCSANVTGAGGLNEVLTVNYLNNVNAGTATASASYTESANYFGSSDSENFTIDKAATTTTVTCGAGPFTYNGLAHEPCSANVTGAGGLNEVLTVNYLNNVNAGTATASASYTESANYFGSSDSENFTIDKAATTTTVTCGAGPFTYNGLAHEPCSANVTGAGGLNSSLTVSYLNNVNAGTATASASYTESANYFASSDSETFQILKAPSTTLVTFEPGPYVFRGTAFTATAQATGAGGLNASVPVVYTGDCTFVTTTNGCTATATYAESSNHLGSSDTKSITILTACSVFNGFLSPIGGSVENGNGGSFADPVRSFKLNSTIPVKFNAMCFGAPLTTGVHTLQAIKYSSATTGDSPIDATPTDAATTGNQFRLTGTEWHFNLSTKGFGNNGQGIWLFKATLFDGSIHSVWVEIKK